MKFYKILIVDDEIDYIKSMFNCIVESNEPYIIYQALNGEQALKIALNECPDLIITDWEMPGMSGIELIEQVKSHDCTAEIPIIMCTGIMTTSENLQTALQTGAVDYIRKPIDKIELNARLKSMLALADSKKELKEKFQIIEQKNKLIQTIIHSISSPFVHYNFDGKILAANANFARLVQSSTESLLYGSLYNYFDAENAGFHRAQDSRLRIQATDISYEYKYQDTEYVISKSLLYGANAEPEGVICLFTDITEMNQTHNEILERNKKELTAGTLRLVQMSELNNNLMAELSALTKHTNKNGAEIIKNALTKFSLNSGENFWKEFEYRFETVHESFYKKLNELYPDLTPGERKLCSLLRLNLSSKDIATITFQNSQSVDMARYRLRKKMNLRQDENLIDFLMNLA